MISKEELIRLAETTFEESDLVDFKQEYSPQKKAAFWAETVKDIVSFANTRGGIIIFGLNDTGLNSGINCDALFELDSASLTDQIRKYTSANYSQVAVVPIVRDKFRYPAILTLPVETPLVFTKVGTYEIENGKQKTAFSLGTVYFRHGSKSEPCTREDLAAFFDRQLEIVRHQWLGNIRRVVEAPIGASVVVTNSHEGGSAVRLTSDPNAPLVHLPQLSDGYPYRQGELIDEINRRLDLSVPLNSHDVQAIKNFENITPQDTPEFVSKPHDTASPQYSQEMVNLVVERYEGDNEFFKMCRTYWKDTKY
jgi:hypothetical protein